MLDRFTHFAARLSPWVVIAGLAYAAVFVEVDVSTEPMPQPFVEGRDLFFGGTAAGGRLWFVGQDGALLSMDETSRQWQRTQMQPVANLQAIAASDKGVLVAVGNGGRYWVRNGDGPWTTQVLPVGEVGNKLVDVAFFHGRFWIVGEMGALFRSDADGANWTRLRDADDVAFNRIRPGPRGSVWIAAEFGRLLHSEDDGATWLSQDLGEESLQSIAFAGDDGVVVGNRGQAFHTTDGGSRWQPVAPFTSEHLYDVLAQAGGWLTLGDRGVLFAGEGGTARWRALAPDGFGKAYHVRLVAAGDGNVAVGRGIGLLETDGNYRRWPEGVQP